jgi:hypothetical protein
VRRKADADIPAVAAVLAREGAPRGWEVRREGAVLGPAVTGPPRRAYDSVRRRGVRGHARARERGVAQRRVLV